MGSQAKYRGAELPPATVAFGPVLPSRGALHRWGHVPCHTHFRHTRYSCIPWPTCRCLGRSFADEVVGGRRWHSRRFIQKALVAVKKMRQTGGEIPREPAPRRLQSPPFPPTGFASGAAVIRQGHGDRCPPILLDRPVGWSRAKATFPPLPRASLKARALPDNWKNTHPTPVWWNPTSLGWTTAKSWADLSLYTRAELNDVARQLNNRPRQTLGWMKPSEVFSRFVASTS